MQPICSSLTCGVICLTSNALPNFPNESAPNYLPLTWRIARILRLIPGLENARFLRYGQIHRNTYINAPTLLTELLNLKRHPNVFFAGQISGVEGYTESIAMGMLAGINVALLSKEATPAPPPRETALGSLVRYLCHAEARTFQPANITFDLLPQLEEATRRRVRDKKLRHKMVCEQALEKLTSWLQDNFGAGAQAAGGTYESSVRY